MRPRIRDELAEKITIQADGILSDAPIDAEDLDFERRLEIVFEAASERTRTSSASDGGTELDYLEDADESEGHPGGESAAEELILEDL